MSVNGVTSTQAAAAYSYSAPESVKADNRNNRPRCVASSGVDVQSLLCFRRSSRACRRLSYLPSPRNNRRTRGHYRTCRNLLGCMKYISRLKNLDAPAILKLLYNRDVCKCPSCGGNIVPLPAGQYYARPKPHLLC